MSRRDFFSQSASLAVAGTVAATVGLGGAADAKPVQRLKDWDPATFEQYAARAARHKVVFACTAINKGTFLNNVKNAANGFQFGFGIPPADFHLIVALHGAANLLSFDHSMWVKYQLGELYSVTDPATDGPALKNLFLESTGAPADQDPDSPGSVFQDKSVKGLQARGVDFFTCHTATEEQAQVIVKKLGLKVEAGEVAKDLLAHRTGTFVVPAMVTVVSLLQEKGFSYVSLG